MCTNQYWQVLKAPPHGTWDDAAVVPFEHGLCMYPQGHSLIEGLGDMLSFFREAIPAAYIEGDPAAFLNVKIVVKKIRNELP